MGFVDMKKAFDRVPRKAMGHLKEGFTRNDGAKTRLRVGSAYSEEFVVDGVYQGSVLSPLVFEIVVDVITENARRSVINDRGIICRGPFSHERNHGRFEKRF